jgi:G3E family GTPase
MDTTPVVLLSGFLGSGKTTVLNHWLSEHRDLAVIVNELGEVGIDQHLAAGTGTPVTLLAGGCVCCAVRGTLSSTLRNLFMARAAGDLPPFRRIVIETTGAADPFGVISVLEQDPWLRKRFHLQAVISTVDCVAGPAVLRRHPEALEQITAADLLLLTKTDRATAGQRQDLEQALWALNPGAGRWACVAGRGDADPLALTFPRRCRITGALAPRSAPPLGGPLATHSPAGAPGHGHGLYPAALRLTGTHSYPRWQAALAELVQTCGERLIRLKGLLAVEKLDGPLLIQGVNAQPLEMTPLPIWPDGDRDSRLVLITDGDADFPHQRLRALRNALQ